MNLSLDQYQEIRAWMYRNARPLDLARWQYLFEEGDPKHVVRALEAYQNPDGGFGHGLEADCWNPNSAPLQTWWAIQFIKEIKLSSKHPMVQAILKYLESEDGMADGRWQFAVPSNNEFPRAPWWTNGEGDDHPGYNPTAALAGFMIINSQVGCNTYEIGYRLASQAIEAFMAREELTEMHELAAYIELYEDLIQETDFEVRQLFKLRQKIQKEVHETIEQDSSKWASDYCCKPSHFFNSPKSSVYQGNEQITEDELNFMVQSMNDEGVWDITWTWGDYQENYAISKRWWQGHLALEHVKMLSNFSRREG